VRSRPLFVRHAPLRRARSYVRRVGGRRATVLGPLVLAVALAVAGQAVRSGAATPVVHAAGLTADRPERGTGAPLSHGRATTRSNVVARHIPDTRRATRASRSRRVTVAGSGWVRPAYGPLTSPFGYRWGRLHKGIDIGAPYGAPIYAAAAGVVTYVGPKAGYGTLVLIRHADGTVTAYGHMSRYATSTGHRVDAGELIAYVGAAGDATGPHLHFEVRIGGSTPIDPRPYLRARGVFY
jgi:murein DD-endopeptidase MepM/ murein hydrolase activator NlpD